VHDVPVVVDADRHHLKFPIFVLVVQDLHRGHFFDTRQAPGSPDIEEYNLSAMVAELHQAALLILDGKIRSFLADIDHARLADSRGLLVDEIPGHGTDNYKENDGFHTFAHAVIVALSTPRN